MLRVETVSAKMQKIQDVWANTESLNNQKKRNLLLAALISASISYLLVYQSTLALFSIDDLTGLRTGETENLYINNLVPKGRYFAFLLADAFEFFGINIYPAYAIWLFLTLILIGGMVAYFSVVMRVYQPVLVVILSVFIGLSPQNFELMHFRHGILIDAATYGGAFWLLFMYSSGFKKYFFLLPGVLMMGGYSSSIPILMTLFGIFLILDIVREQRPFLSSAIFYVSLLFGTLVIHYGITAFLTELYGRAASSQSLVTSVDEFKKTWRISQRSAWWMLDKSTASVIPQKFHLALVLAASGALVWSIKQNLVRGLAALICVLIILMNFFSFYILPFKINYLPGRSYLHVQVVTSFFVILLLAVMAGRFRVKLPVLIVSGLGALVFMTSALEHSNGISSIRILDEAIAAEFIATSNTYSSPPAIYVHYDVSSVRQRERQLGVVGDLKSLFYATWSRYNYLERMGLPNDVLLDKNSERIKVFADACTARKNEDFMYKIEKGETYLYMCL